MKIVITGATGNVGTALLRSLEGRGHRVVGIARRRPTHVTPYDLAESWWTIDVGDPTATTSLTQAFAGADTVVHLAWQFQPSRRRDELRRTGVDGSVHVFDAAAEAGVPHVVHMSSCAVYTEGPPGRVFTEDGPRTGVPDSPYSVDKVAVEDILDQRTDGSTITRLRPGLIGQRSGASALLRYGLPPAFPLWLLRRTPVLPLDRSLAMPGVHADDVADAIVRCVERRAGGAFNLAGESAIGADDFARAFRARIVPISRSWLARLVDWSFRAHAHSVPMGWVHLAYGTPLLDCSRARDELGWTPRHDAPEVFAEFADGLRTGAGADSPVLHPRRVREELVRFAREGSVSRRRLS